MLQKGYLPKPNPNLSEGIMVSDENNTQTGFFSDYLGISGSILCLIHCIAPQLLFLGTIGLGMVSIFSSGWWHLFFWATCLLAVWKSSRISQLATFQVILWFAFILFTVGTALDLFFDVENLFSYAGSVLLVLGHGWNLWRLSKKSNQKTCAV